MNLVDFVLFVGIVSLFGLLIYVGAFPHSDIQAPAYSIEAKLINVKYYYDETGALPGKATILTFESNNTTYVFKLSGYHPEYFSNIGCLYRIELYDDGSLAKITKIEGDDKNGKN